jgi:hypothetical protein
LVGKSSLTVFSVDEKTAIQALDRKDPVLPLSPGRAERHGFEYFRHGTLSLKSTDGTVSHWKYVIGNAIVYRGVYRASSDRRPFENGRADTAP